MLANEYDHYIESSKRVAMPKLNGIRAMWIPRMGLWSRDGLVWAPDNLPHIYERLRNVDIMLDGELYRHGMPLAEISARVSINRKTPHEDCRSIQFHVFDMPQSNKNADDRHRLIDKEFSMQQIVCPVQWRAVACCMQADAAFNAFVAGGYEGAMYKSMGNYVNGRSSALKKRKAWKIESMIVIEGLEGVDRLAGTLGSLRLSTNKGKQFKVGTGQGLTDDVRHALWAKRDQLPGMSVRVRYLELSPEGIPLAASILV